MANTDQQIQALASQVQQLTAQLSSQQQELTNMRAALEQQAQATNAALIVAQSAAVESQVGQSDSDWERFKFGFTSWIGTVDPEYPDLLKVAAAQTDEINPAEMISPAKGLCTDLFAILLRLCQSGEIPAMAMLVPDRNGFELWRRMHARFEPENKHKFYAWLRALSNPVFPNNESQWQRGLEQWEGEIAKYEREYKKTFGEDLKLAILSEVAPKTLAPLIAMHSAHLTTYKTLREFIVQYLKSKNLWKRGAGTAFGTQFASPAAPFSGPAPMEIGAVEADNRSKPKGDKGGKSDKKGKPGKGPKGASSKGDGKGKDKSKAEVSNANATKGPPCAICGPEKGKNHTTEACYFNARSFLKGDGKGKRTPTPGSTNIAAVEGTAFDNSDLSSTIASLQQQLAALRLSGASSVSASSTSSANVGRKGQATQGAISQTEQPMLFAVVDAEVAEAVCSTVHGDGRQKKLDASKRKQLWAINGTPIQQQGELAADTALSATTVGGEGVEIPARFRLDSTDITEPVMAVCRILDDADCDMHFYRSSSGKPAHIETPDGHNIVLPRFGSYSASHPAFVAAQHHEDLEDDVSAGPVEEDGVDVDLDRQPGSPKPRHLPAPVAPTDDERALHSLGAAIASLAKHLSLDTIDRSRTKMSRCQSCSLITNFSAVTVSSLKKKAVQLQSLRLLTLPPDGH
ncbi:unnamed protein product [Symbiodinium sp. CCMP2592]|nr:unnamed protein product [Symbiodinium sp. CCMP2592]